MKPLVTALFFMLLWSSSACLAGSCDSVECACTESDMSPAGIMAGHRHVKGEWMFSYRYMNTYMKGRLSGRQSISDEMVYRQYIMSPEKMTMQMHMLMAMYGISDRLSVTAMVNY